MNIDYLLNLKAYVINMPDKESNFIRCKEELNKHGFKNINRFVSFDSQDEELLINKSCELGLTKFYGSNPQQSLSLAHFHIMNELINSKSDAYLVFEDDMVFHSEFDNLIESKITNIDTSNFDILFLGSRVINNQLIDCDFVVKKNGILHCHAYMITKKASVKVFEQCRSKGYMAIDQVFNMLMCGQLNQVAIIQSPKTSNNINKIRTKEEEMTGLMYQLRHPSTVSIHKDLIRKQWDCV